MFICQRAHCFVHKKCQIIYLHCQFWSRTCHFKCINPFNLHPLQAANCCRNSRLVVDGDDLMCFKIKENYHVLVNQFHGNFRSKTLCCRKIKSVFREVKWCFSASWGLKGLNGSQYIYFEPITHFQVTIVNTRWIAESFSINFMIIHVYLSDKVQLSAVNTQKNLD